MLEPLLVRMVGFRRQLARLLAWLGATQFDVMTQRVFLYIDADRDTGQGNKVILDQLMLHQERIEQDFGGPLDWLPMEGKRACVIRKKIAIGGWQDEERWPESQEALIDTMVAIEAAIRPFLDQINKV